MTKPLPHVVISRFEESQCRPFSDFARCKGKVEQELRGASQPATTPTTALSRLRGKFNFATDNCIRAVMWSRAAKRKTTFIVRSSGRVAPV